MLPRPGSSLNGRRPLPASGPQRQLMRQPSQVRIALPFIPSQDVPVDVKPFNVPSKQSLAAEFTRTIGFFAGRETEDNWVQRERAIGLYRGIVWGNAATELRDALVSQLKEHIHSILHAVSSLRTSLSGFAMGLCDDIAARLGPHGGGLFDPIVDALFKQCAQTKKIGAQRASKSLTAAYQAFPLRTKGLEQLRLRISEKSAVLRLAVVTACTGIVRSHGAHIDPSDRRNADLFAPLIEIAKTGLTDAQPSVREPARELFWELHSLFEAHTNRVLSELPDHVAVSLNRDRAKYARAVSSDGHHRSPNNRPPSVPPLARTPSGARGRAPGSRASFESTRESLTPGIISAVAGHNPQHSPLTGQVSLASGHSAGLLSTAQESVNPPARNPACSLEAADEAEEANDDVDSVMFVESSPANKPHMRIKELRTPVRERMSLGLIDFSKMEIGPSLLDIGSAPERVVEAAALEVTEPESCLESERHDTTTATPRESQATAVMPDSIEHSLILAASDQPTACIDTSESKSPAKIASSQVLTPDKTPRMSPSLHTSTGSSSVASTAAFPAQFVTPRTQSARYWNGPLEAAPPSLQRQTTAESPMAADTPQRLNKVELCLRRLTDNSGVNEALFRCLARFAKEESSTVWMGEAQGGRAYLDRILGACLGWLQNPAEGRDAVFTKDSCFDVLRVLVRRKSQYFTLDAARRLLLEVLRNRFFESTILSGSAEDV
ncbi:suppressor of tub2 mutation, partial [Coemansia sp. RSA 2705]